ncbi:uncharacterized protein BO80DRAFT_133559 [Aspergillus ibericus CBS 121593]|uniref:DNA polymerase lambda fingers domain-containing protein n=1 Tax=Aspergillus ibericus CBS 121593 TaxID=1448316 RepID=A0A395HE85_9EURO|nr:hypothetical protein BO80DRAFT_133559 [Aspergillus ibericus CBS 121593]RAL05298.1 hypothetical protein BO80DRAFT_133559 [Aspergillus ibericus CBS 121593]
MTLILRVCQLSLSLELNSVTVPCRTTRTDDHWRMLAYHKALSAHRRQPKKIVTNRRPWLFHGLESVWQTRSKRFCVQTDSTWKLNHNTRRPYTPSFLGCLDVGVTQASKWLAQGYRLLTDLRTKAPILQQQRVGVDHYYGFSAKLRLVVGKHGKNTWKAIQYADSVMDAADLFFSEAKEAPPTIGHPSIGSLPIRATMPPPTGFLSLVPQPSR